MSEYRLFIGEQGESKALDYLEKKGHQLVVKNYRCKAGEIDLITIDQNFIVFIEVKTRTSSKIDPLISITKKKQVKLRNLAKWFLVQKPKYERYQPRFDVIAIKSVAEQPLINHIINAF